MTQIDRLPSIIPFRGSETGSANSVELKTKDYEAGVGLICDLAFEARQMVLGAREILNALNDGMVVVISGDIGGVISHKLIEDDFGVFGGFVINQQKFNQLQKGERRMAVGKAATSLYADILRANKNRKRLQKVSPEEFKFILGSRD